MIYCVFRLWHWKSVFTFSLTGETSIAHLSETLSNIFICWNIYSMFWLQWGVNLLYWVQCIMLELSGNYLLTYLPLLNWGIRNANDIDNNKVLKAMSVRGKWHRWDLVHREVLQGRNKVKVEWKYWIVCVSFLLTTASQQRVFPFYTDSVKAGCKEVLAR